jgi:hypothetical protein
VFAWPNTVAQFIDLSTDRAVVSVDTGVVASPAYTVLVDTCKAKCTARG